jgi:GxxExxY protein
MNHQDTKSTKGTPRKDLDDATETLASQVVDAAIKVHRLLGPGLLESVYQSCFVQELRSRGIKVQSQVVLPIIYEGVELESGLRIDLLVGGKIVVELKAVDELHPVHFAQLLTYLRLSERRLGFLINFNVPKLVDGLHRRVL